MSRLLPLLALIAILLLGDRVAVSAAQVPLALGSAFSSLADGEGDEKDDGDRPPARAKDAGSIDGEVVSVDYRTNRMSVRSGGQVYDVTVLPSTDFRGRTNSFHAITDIKRGAHVNIMLSQRAHMLTAQIIHLQ